MTDGPIMGKMLVFALPLILSNILQMTFNAADMIIAGHFAGDNAMAAVGSNSSLINLMLSMFIGIALGVNVVTAQYYGGGKIREIEETVHTAVLLAIICGTVLAVAGVVFTRQFMLIMKSPDDVIELSVIYLRIYFLGMPAVLVYNFCSAILRAVGDTRRPMYMLSFAGALNVALDLLFVAVLDGAVAGVAIATVISQYCSAIGVMYCLVAERGAVRLNLKRLRLCKPQVYRIMRLGLPSGVQGALFSVSNVMIQSSINSFGSVAVAGNTAAVNIENYVYYVMNGFSQATLSFCSQSVGAGKPERLRRIVWVSVMYVLVSGMLMGGSIMLWSRELLGIYTDTAASIAVGDVRLHIICSTYFFCGLMEIMVSAMRGMGISVCPMIVSLTGACGLRILWLNTIFRLDKFHTIETVFVSYPVTWIVTFVVQMCFLLYFLRRLCGTYSE